MKTIAEILQLPAEEQVAILEAIQDNLDDFENNDTLNEEHIAFIKERVQSIDNSKQETYSWQKIKELLKNKWNTQ